MEAPAAAIIKAPSKLLLSDEEARKGLSYKILGDDAVITRSDGRNAARIPAQINC